MYIEIKNADVYKNNNAKFSWFRQDRFLPNMIRKDKNLGTKSTSKYLYV